MDMPAPKLAILGRKPAIVAALRDVLGGAKTPYRDVALCNAAASLIVAGKAKDRWGQLALPSSTRFWQVYSADFDVVELLVYLCCCGR